MTRYPADVSEETVDYLNNKGALLLDELHDWLRAYVAWPSEAGSRAVALWVVHTHLMERWEMTPRLALLSPEKRCGKSLTLKLLQWVCAAAETLSTASPSYMFRRLAQPPVTVLLDEADAIWKRGKADESAEALRSIVNAGYEVLASVGRTEMVGQRAELTRFPVYGPVALAGIGDCLPDTVMDRAVVIPMRRRATGEQVGEYRSRIVRPEGEALRERIAEWAASVGERVGDPWPPMPPGVTDRAADIWEPLLSVADLAGGDWPDRARDACLELLGGRTPDDDTLGVRLLADLRDIFGMDEDVMFTETIKGKLHAIEEAPWGDWYGREFGPRDLAKLLKPYGVRSRNVRVGDDQGKGYRRLDLEDPWSRYLPALPGGSVPSVPPSQADEIADLTSEDAWDGRGTEAVSGSVPHPDQREHADWDAGTHGTDTPGRACPHGMPNGDLPDPFVNGRLRCPRCRAETGDPQ